MHGPRSLRTVTCHDGTHKCTGLDPFELTSIPSNATAEPGRATLLRARGGTFRVGHHHTHHQRGRGPLLFYVYVSLCDALAATSASHQCVVHMTGKSTSSLKKAAAPSAAPGRRGSASSSPPPRRPRPRPRPPPARRRRRRRRPPPRTATAPLAPPAPSRPRRRAGALPTATTSSKSASSAPSTPTAPRAAPRARGGVVATWKLTPRWQSTTILGWLAGATFFFVIPGP